MIHERIYYNRRCGDERRGIGTRGYTVIRETVMNNGVRPPARQERLHYARHLVVSDRILQVMRGTPDCRLDDLLLSCREFPLQAVLSEVSRLRVIIQG